MWFYCGKTIVFKGSDCKKWWKKNRKIYANLELDKSVQNPIKINLGRVLGSIWEGFGVVLGFLWVLLAASWPLFERSKSNFFQAFAQNGLQEGFWMDLGSLCEDFGRVWGGFVEKFWEDFGFFEHTVGRFWKCLAWFRPAGADSLKWTPALIREASQCAGVLPLRVLNQNP